MPLPILTPDQISYFAEQVNLYISSQRAAYYHRAIPINPTHRDSLVGFFPESLLENTRVAAVEQPVENPPFYPELRSMGFDNLPEFSDMAAITFVDVIVSHVPITCTLLFHEMVHAAQYRILGVNRFSRLYVEGFLHGGSYERIPLETNAFHLEQRFGANPTHLFSVEAEVLKWLDAGKF